MSWRTSVVLIARGCKDEVVRCRLIGSDDREYEMDVSVMIRRTEHGTFRAIAAMPEVLSAEAATREEALRGLTELIRGQLCGAEFVEVHVPTPNGVNPWLMAAGSWADHPDLCDVERHIRDYRRQIDEDPLQP